MALEKIAISFFFLFLIFKWLMNKGKRDKNNRKEISAEKKLHKSIVVSHFLS